MGTRSDAPNPKAREGLLAAAHVVVRCHPRLAQLRPPPPFPPLPGNQAQGHGSRGRPPPTAFRESPRPWERRGRAPSPGTLAARAPSRRAARLLYASGVPAPNWEGVGGSGPSRPGKIDKLVRPLKPF